LVFIVHSRYFILSHNLFFIGALTFFFIVLIINFLKKFYSLI